MDKATETILKLLGLADEKRLSSVDIWLCPDQPPRVTIERYARELDDTLVTERFRLVSVEPEESAELAAARAGLYP